MVALMAGPTVDRWVGETAVGKVETTAPYSVGTWAIGSADGMEATRAGVRVSRMASPMDDGSAAALDRH